MGELHLALGEVLLTDISYGIFFFWLCNYNAWSFILSPLKKMCWIYLNLCQKPLVALPLTEEWGVTYLPFLVRLWFTLGSTQSLLCAPSVMSQGNEAYGQVKRWSNGLGTMTTEPDRVIPFLPFERSLILHYKYLLCDGTIFYWSINQYILVSFLFFCS